MRTDFHEKGIDTRDAEQKKDPYEQYQELGGIINREDYENALARAHDAATTPEKMLIGQAELMAEFAGIELHNTKDAVDQRITLYEILRADSKPEEIKYHHSQMSDQRLFAEVLRMLGDTDSLNKLIGAYHKVGTHCPICLKVVTSGEKCL
ncbi:MAG: hypothetical protein Q7R61_02180 [bacterium]|nr:hypothetical protein [bacterium]